MKFDISRFEKQPGRWVGLVVAWIPLILILVLTKVWHLDAISDNLEGRPHNATMNAFIIIALVFWAFALMLSCFRYELGSLLTCFIMSLLLTIFILVWMWHYTEDSPVKGAPWTFMTLLFGAWLAFTFAMSRADRGNRWSVALGTLLVVPTFVWLITKMVFNYVEVNSVTLAADTTT